MRANPTALIQSSVIMLKYLGEYEYANKIERALEKVFMNDEKLTTDLDENSIYFYLSIYFGELFRNLTLFINGVFFPNLF